MRQDHESIAATSANATIQNLSLSYDAAGNVQGITDALNAGRTQSFGYDDLNRLDSASSDKMGSELFSCRRER